MWNQGNQAGFVPIPDLPQQQPPNPNLPNYQPYPGGPGYPQHQATTGYPPPQPTAVPYPQPPGAALGYPYAGAAPQYPSSAPAYPNFHPHGVSAAYPPQAGTVGNTAGYPQLNTAYPSPAANPPQIGFPQAGAPGPQYPPTNPTPGGPQYSPSSQQPPYQQYTPAAAGTTGYPSYPSPSGPVNAQSNQVDHPTNLGPVHMASSMQPHQEIPTIRPSNTDPLADAQILRKAMKGFGTDEAAIINVLTKRTNNERLNISRAYKQSFGKVLHIVTSLISVRWEQ